MKKALGFLFFTLFSLTSILAQKGEWLEMVALGGQEIYIDTASVERNGVEVAVWVKEVYTKEVPKQYYISRIAKAMSETESGRKSWEKKWAKKFEDLSYTISKRVYNCVDSEFQVLEVSEYDSNGKRIVKTTTKKNKAPWKPIEYDTIGDILMFEVCDNY